MPLPKLVIAIVCLVVALSACNNSASSSSVSGGATSSSASASEAQQEVLLSGATGLAELAGDKVEIKEGSVFVNGASFGPVPDGAAVKYQVNAQGRTLFVGAERRSVQK